MDDIFVFKVSSYSNRVLDKFVVRIPFDFGEVPREKLIVDVIFKKEPSCGVDSGFYWKKYLKTECTVFGIRFESKKV